MQKLYIDFDGVILDTIPLLYSDLEKANINSKDEKAVREYFATYDFASIINDNFILNDSIKCIQKLIDSNLFDVSILTHINSLNEGVVKVNYLRNYFKSINIFLVPKEISKTKIVHVDGSILVDDYSGNLEEWKKCNGIPVRFSTINESKGFIMISKLDELIDIFGDKNGNN